MNLARLWVNSEEEVFKIYNTYKDKVYFDYEECKSLIEKDLIKKILEKHSKRADILVKDAHLSRELALNLVECQEKQKS